MSGSVDPGEMRHSAASRLCPHLLLRPVCLNTYGKYSMHIFMTVYFKVKARFSLQAFEDLYRGGIGRCLPASVSLPCK